MRISTVLAAAGFLVSAAHGGVTTALKTIGGPGGLSCCGTENPPTLCDGNTEASARVSFSYDDVARTLTLVVENTSPVEPGVPNPLLTKLHFNAPPGTVTGLALLSQSGSGGATPTWNVVFDPDPTSGTKPAKLGCLGAFSARLSNGNGIHEAIANGAADTFEAPPGSWVVGPVTFVFDVETASDAVVDASAFANASSHNPPGVHSVNLGAHFQAGGPQGKSGKISTSAGCEPGEFLQGTPSIGSTVTLSMTGTPGCCGCLGVSDNPGPLLLPNIPGAPPILVPLGNPVHVLISTTTITSGTPVSVAIPIPNDLSLVGQTFYFATVLFLPATGELFSSAGSSVTILP